MKKTILNAVILSVFLGCAVIPFAGCDTGSSNDTDAPNTDVPNTDDPAAAKLDFESANIASIIAAGGLTSDVGDVNGTWGESSPATSDMVYVADATNYDLGTGSLKVTATALQNKYSPNVAQWAIVTDLSKGGISTPVNLNGKTVSIKALVPAAGNLTAVKLVFIDSDGKKSQGKEAPITAKDTWTEATYKYVGDIPAAEGGSATSDYTAGGFDITKVTAICVVAIRNGASANSPSETLYLDSVNW